MAAGAGASIQDSTNFIENQNQEANQNSATTLSFPTSIAPKGSSSFGDNAGASSLRYPWMF